MRVCMLDPLFHPYYGGTEKHVLEISKRLVKKGITIEVLTSQLPGTERHDLISGIKITRTPAIYLSKLPSFMPPPYTVQPFIALEILRNQSDIFHIHNRFWYHLATLAAIKLRGKLVTTLHNAKPEGISFLTDNAAWAYDLLWGHRILELSDAIIAVSEYTRNVTVPERLWHKCHVIHNGVDTKRFAPRKKEARKIRKWFNALRSPLILSNGRLVPQKGFVYLIKAFAEVKKTHPDAKLVVIGKGPLKESLLKLAGELGVKDSVFFVTGIPEEELPLYYNACDVFAFPTLWEPCAVALIEALASGCAIVTTNVGGNTEIVADTALVVEPRSSHMLAQGILKLLSDRKLARKLAKKARERATRYFTWDRAARKTLEVYERVME